MTNGSATQGDTALTETAIQPRPGNEFAHDLMVFAGAANESGGQRIDVEPLLALASELRRLGYGVRSLRGLRGDHARALIESAIEGGSSGEQVTERIEQVRQLAALAGKPNWVPATEEMFTAGADPADPAQFRWPEQARGEGDLRLSNSDRRRYRGLVETIMRLDRIGGPVERHVKRSKAGPDQDTCKF